MTRESDKITFREDPSDLTKGNINRRQFLGTVAAASVALGPWSRSTKSISSAATTWDSRIMLRPFDYRGVKLGRSRWQQQYASARDFYLSVSNDDILHGFRRAAGLNAPGAPLGGWAGRDSSVIFGQWLQAMARTSQANDDTELRDKATFLVDEWAKTLGADGNPRMRHYPWEKLVGGLSDMRQYAGHGGAPALLEKVVDWGVKALDRTRTPAANKPWELHSGVPLEWYTLSENLYRAHQLTGNAKYKEFGDVWRYDAYWNKFADNSAPTNAHGVHAYSHCNSFSGAAMAYLIEGDTRLLRIMENFCDFLQDSQCYATGGYGPAERYVINDGALGESLTSRLDSFEAPCCTWAAFKLARYLTMFTGQSRYGDWIERLLYNGIGAALPIVENGKHFYYANYHLGAGMKVYSRNNYTCCSGTYFQSVAEYQNLIYFKDETGLYVNLYLSSEVTWETVGRSIRLTQQTDYPEGDTIAMRLEMAGPANFSLNLRVPGWAAGVSVKVNGEALDVPAPPGRWASIHRTWRGGDVVEMTIPLHFRRAPIDRWHPNRVAVVRGPVVYAQQIVHKHLVSIPPDDEALNEWLVATDNPAVFRYAGQEQSSQRDDFMPFYRFAELQSYRMYFDSALRNVLW
ncbi:MAG: glycoside hydrolase family 127 protein [Sedimentisphaerales bacterium]|nr:glycoside hydrolase family 127 protein [Sedimentisphaerales bacterium]